MFDLSDKGVIINVYMYLFAGIYLCVYKCICIYKIMLKNAVQIFDLMDIGIFICIYMRLYVFTCIYL
jgi:hypothetical protein